MRPRAGVGTLLRMAARSYAVTWQNGDGVLRSGKAELRAHALHLEAGHGESEHVRYDALEGISFGRTAAERIAGRPTLVLSRHDGTPIRLASVAQLGILSELAERLADLHLGSRLARNRILVVLPLRDGVEPQVRALLDKGPPFDPDDAGLRQHQVFLTDREAVFVFDAADAGSLHRLFSDASVWAAATVWGEFAGGPIRIGDEAFAWAKSSAGNGTVA